MRMRASRAKVAGLQEIATTRRQGRGGECTRLRRGARPRRIEDDGIEGGKFGRAKRPAEEVARLGVMLAQARRRRCPRVERRDGGRIAVDGVHRRASASLNANAPAPQNRSATCFAPAGARRRRPASAASPASVACRKPPGGGTTKRAAFSDGGRPCSTRMSPCTDSRARSRRGGGFHQHQAGPIAWHVRGREGRHRARPASPSPARPAASPLP